MRTMKIALAIALASSTALAGLTFDAGLADADHVDAAYRIAVYRRLVEAGQRRGRDDVLGQREVEGLHERRRPVGQGPHTAEDAGEVVLDRGDRYGVRLGRGRVSHAAPRDGCRARRAAPPAPEVREAIKSGKFDAVCFTSSSTVRNLVGIAGKPHPSTVVAVIGPATANAAEESGLHVDVMAPEASSDALVDALAAHGLGLAIAAQEAGEPVRRPSETKSTARRRAR